MEAARIRLLSTIISFLLTGSGGLLAAVFLRRMPAAWLAEPEDARSASPWPPLAAACGGRGGKLRFLLYWFLLPALGGGLLGRPLPCCALLVLQLAATVDGARRIIPDQCSLALAFLALLQLCCGQADWRGALLGFAFSLLPGLLPALFGLLGFGDAKLFAALGLFLGRQCPFTLAAAFLLSGFAGGLLLLTGRKKRSEAFAFAPFLYLAFLLYCGGSCRSVSLFAAVQVLLA